MRNNSPIQFAFLTALTISVLGGLLLFGSFSLIGNSFGTLEIILFLIIIFALTYYAVFFAIERFIYRKIKLIYKTIHNLKIGKDSNVKVKMNEDAIEIVNNEVLKWASDKKEEITKLKNQEEFRREFLGNLAHELKTPIFSVQGYILTLLEGGLEDKTINRDFLYRALKNVERMTYMIEDLDTITQFESGQLEVVIDKVDMVQLVKETFETLEIKAKKRNISLNFNKSYPSPIYVHADEERITQVIINLLANSIKYGTDHGQAEVRFYDMDENILIEVSDDGPGIEQHHLIRLFERFYRVDKSRSRDQGGTGLGLSICKHILEAHHQSINVRSTIGQGTTFSFTLKKY